MARILFFDAPVKRDVYAATNIKVGTPSYPNMTLATLAGSLIKDHKVKIIDLELVSNHIQTLIETIRHFKPDLIATSAKTTEYLAARELMRVVKKQFPSIKTIIGGVHITVFPEDVIAEDCFDIVVIGEGDTVIPEILSSSSLKKVPGIGYKDKFSKKPIFTAKRGLIHDINKLSYPAWKLFDLTKYKNSRLSSRQNPVGHLETSRGCSYQCNFCNKLTFGTYYRVKEPKRVVDEIEYMLECGFKEIHITDDSFTQNIDRAKEVCREIIRRKLKFPWSLINGVRVNLVDVEFFRLAKEAGCWQTGFGIETGDQRVLNRIHKNITLAQVTNAAKLAEQAGIDTFGFFILGLAGETVKSMQKTVDFAKSLPLTTAKFGICIPYPGTEYFRELEKLGKIRTYDWSKYKMHQTEDPLFDHPNLTWNQITYYREKAFREFYLRPDYAFRRLKRDIRMGDIFYDISYFVRSVRNLF